MKENEYVVGGMLFLGFVIIIASGMTCASIKKNYEKMIGEIVEKNCNTLEGGCYENLEGLIKIKSKIVVLITVLILIFSLQIFITFDKKIWEVFMTIILGSLLGVASKIFQNYKDDILGTIKCIFISLCSAAMLPLFLNIIQSNLLQNILSENKQENINNYHSMLTLFAFSVLTSIFADKIIKILGDKYIAKLSETNDELKKAKENFEEKIENLTKKIKEKDEKISILMKSIPADQREEFGESDTDEEVDEPKPNYEAVKKMVGGE